MGIKHRCEFLEKYLAPLYLDPSPPSALLTFLSDLDVTQQQLRGDKSPTGTRLVILFLLTLTEITLKAVGAGCMRRSDLRCKKMRFVLFSNHHSFLFRRYLTT
jgi:hypothetical protein